MSRWFVGPSIEIRAIPKWDLRIEASALYQPMRLRISGSGFLESVDQAGPARTWVFPLLLKRPLFRQRFFVSTGAVLRKAGPFDLTGSRTTVFPTVQTQSATLSIPTDSKRIGVAAGGGLRLPLKGPWQLEPEVRYTHWTAQRYLPSTEQVDFVLGLRLGSK